MEQINNKMSTYIDMAIEYAPKVLLGLLALLIGLWIISKIVKMLGNVMNRSSLDKSVQPFLLSLVGVILKVMLLFSVAETVGLQTTSFIAVLAAAGFAVGMALQGSLPILLLVLWFLYSSHTK